jgi:hypothetical protein
MSLLFIREGPTEETERSKFDDDNGGDDQGEGDVDDVLDSLSSCDECSVTDDESPSVPVLRSQ